MNEHIHVIARSTDPETSHEAAAAFDKDQEKVQRSVRTVIKILEDHGSMTDFDLREDWPSYWGKAFSEHLPRMARHWAREKGFVKHVGFGKHHKRRVRIWGLGKEIVPDLIRCPTCERKTRAEKVIATINRNRQPKPPVTRTDDRQGTLL